MNKNILGVSFILIAILSLIFAFTCFGMYTGGYESNLSYGGDAYTGIQNASAQAANNIQTLTENFNAACGYAFLICAATFASLGCAILPADSKLKKSAANIAAKVRPATSESAVEEDTSADTTAE